MKNFNCISLLAITIMLSGCNTFQRLSEVGSPPQISRISNPTSDADYSPVTMPMPKEQAAYSNPNSLWQPGAKGFFKDQRASKVGDILTVNIAIKDSATVNSSSALKRGADSDSLSIGALGGFEKYIKKNLPEGADLTNLVDIDSSKTNSGSGTTGRNETINLTLSAVITQVLPNGNLVIEGTQEVRVNYELRQLQLNGVIRREDISSQNTIESSQVAELRVAYGGRGTVSDLQQPRVGRQILDVILPF